MRPPFVHSRPRNPFSERSLVHRIHPLIPGAAICREAGQGTATHGPCRVARVVVFCSVRWGTEGNCSRAARLPGASKRPGNGDCTVPVAWRESSSSAAFAGARKGIVRAQRAFQAQQAAKARRLTIPLAKREEMVEAAGIEPASGEHEPKVSTCVAFVGMSHRHRVGRRPPPRRPASLGIRREERGHPRAIDPLVVALSGVASHTPGRTSRLKPREPSFRWQVSISVFTSGTRHAAPGSHSSPSKPGRPHERLRSYRDRSRS